MKTIITLISTVILMTACHTTPTPSNKYEEIVLATAKSKARDPKTFELLKLEFKDTVTYLDSLRIYREAVQQLHKDAMNEGNGVLFKLWSEELDSINLKREQWGNKKDYVLYYEYFVGATVKDVWGETKPALITIHITPDYRVLETTITSSLGINQSKTD